MKNCNKIFALGTKTNLHFYVFYLKNLNHKNALSKAKYLIFRKRLQPTYHFKGSSCFKYLLKIVTGCGKESKKSSSFLRMINLLSIVKVK